MAESLSKFTPKQKRIVRQASKKAHIPSRVLFAQIHTETRNNPKAVSSAGARGVTQFMPTTGETYGVRYSGKGSYRSQVDAAARYLNDLGYQQDPRKAVAGYAGGPGNPQYGYADALLQTAEGYRGYGAEVKGAKYQRAGRTRLKGELVTVPGVDNSAARDQLRMQTLSMTPGSMPTQEELLGLGAGLNDLRDTPDTTTIDLKRVGQRGGRSRAGKSGSGDVMGMLRKAVAWDKAKVPYLWGGGHGAIAKPGQPVDCSGYVSAVLGLDTPQVSGNLASWGKPGKGKNVTVYASPTHTFMSIRDPRTNKLRWFGTSKQNPGGGAGEIAPPSASYLSGFVARHPA